MRPDLNDTDLERELRRRADSARVRNDWARIELLPVVRTAVVSRPQPLTASRLSPLAGIAAVAAIVVLLVVALPRFVPTPGATTEPSPSADPGFVVLSTQEFEARLAAGDLVGSTVLIDGRIEPVPQDPPLACSPSHEVCFIGQLVDRSSSVFSALVETTEDDEKRSIIQSEDGGWNFWRLPQPPVEGILVFAVSEIRKTEYLGRIRPASNGLTWSASEAAAIDLESLALDEIVLVDGWLTGLGGLISGRPPEPGTVLAGLPQRYSGSPTWVLDEPVALDPSGYQEPEAGIRVQNGAYYEFAPNPALVDASSPTLEPRRATYALTRRLEGGGCPGDDPPCWQWNIVGGLTPNSRPAAPNTPEPSTDLPLPTTPPTMLASTFECSEPVDRIGAVVVDEADIVESCATVEPSGGLGDRDYLVRNPTGDVTQLQIEWAGSPCHAAAGWTIRRSPTGLTLEIGPRPDGQFLGVDYEGGVVCRLSGAVHAIRLQLRDEIDAADVVFSAPNTASPTPAPRSPGLVPLPTPAPSGEFDDGLLIVTTADPEAAATRRLESLLGANGCTGTTSHDREISHRTLVEWAEAVEGEGLTQNGWGWVGDRQDAARAFGAFELYLYEPPDVPVIQILPGIWTEGWIVAVATGAPWLTLGGEGGLFAHPMPPGALIVADLTGIRVGSRTLWIPAYTGQTVGTSSCHDGVIQETSAAGPVADMSSGDFRLAMSAGQPTYEADAPIDVEAAITYVGGRPVTVQGDSSWIFFGFEQLDGDLQMYPASQLMGDTQELVPGEPYRQVYSKSGGYESNGPHADFYRRYFEEPELKLPAGTYRIFASTFLSIAGDPSADRSELETSIVIRVTGG